MFVRFSYGLSSLCAVATWQTITLLQQHYVPEVAIPNSHCPLFKDSFKLFPRCLWPQVYSDSCSF